jgi:2-polyprenyl-6-hydroxyphenyl methylase/3-demethylubiquinone-9 3-methyltransferase
MAKEDLRNPDTHFAFGRNWASFSETINEDRIQASIEELERLLGGTCPAGCRFLDIGCGSGLHSVAAIRLGAAEVHCVDIDADSVATTRHTLARLAPGASVSVEQKSVFDLDASTAGLFDVVYSWGVLHHTGDMHNAIDRAARLVKPGGRLIIALYRKTWLCPLWTLEKRWYVKATPAAQQRMFNLYVGFMKLRARIRGRDFEEFKRNFWHKRGMSYEHDVRDWIGGYPYESISPRELIGFLGERGFRLERGFYKKRRKIGLLGSGNDQFVFRRN